MPTTGTGKLKKPRVCLKTVTTNPRSAKRVGAPRYICPTSGGKQAVSSMGKLPVKPEDVERIIEERKKLRPIQAAGPQNLTDTIHFKDPKKASWETPYDTIHYKDPSEAKGQKLDDTIHFEDPQEAQEKKQMKLFGKSLVEKESVYISGDLIKAKAFSFQQGRPSVKSEIEGSSKNKVRSSANKYVGDVKKLISNVSDFAPKLAKVLWDDYKKNPEQAIFDIGFTIATLVPEPTSTAAGAIAIGSRVAGFGAKINSGYRKVKKYEKVGGVIFPEKFKAVKTAKEFSSVARQISKMSPAQLAGSAGATAATAALVAEAKRGKKARDKKPEIVSPREQETPERGKRRAVPAKMVEVIRSREQARESSRARRGSEELSDVPLLLKYDSVVSPRLAKEPVHRDPDGPKSREQNRRPIRRPGPPSLSGFGSDDKASYRSKRVKGGGKSEGSSSGKTMDRRAGSRKKGGSKKASISDIRDVLRKYRRIGMRQESTDQIVKQASQASGSKKPKIMGGLDKALSDNNRLSIRGDLVKAGPIKDWKSHKGTSVNKEGFDKYGVFVGRSWGKDDPHEPNNPDDPRNWPVHRPGIDLPDPKAPSKEAIARFQEQRKTQRNKQKWGDIYGQLSAPPPPKQKLAKKKGTTFNQMIRQNIKHFKDSGVFTAPEIKKIGGSVNKSFHDENRRLSKSMSFVAPIARQVRSKKISLKAALDRVPWWMQDDLLEYLRGKKK